MKKLIGLILSFAYLISFELYSPDFHTHISINQVYNLCGGKNISPTLIWKNPPPNTKSFAITMFDPDAPTPHGWWHWLVVNIPANVRTFPKNAGNPESKYFNLGFQTINDYGKIGYGGPCPPPGKAHRYIITLYALNIKRLNISRDINPQKLYYLILSHTIKKISIEGKYKRK